MQFLEQGLDEEKMFKRMPFHLKECQIPKKNLSLIISSFTPALQSSVCILPSVCTLRYKK